MQVQDSENAEIAKGEAVTTINGACDFDFILPSTVPLGKALLVIEGKPPVIGSPPLVGAKVLKTFEVKRVSIVSSGSS